MALQPSIRIEGGLLGPDLIDQLRAGELPGQKTADFAVRPPATPRRAAPRPAAPPALPDLRGHIRCCHGLLVSLVEAYEAERWPIEAPAVPGATGSGEND